MEEPGWFYAVNGQSYGPFSGQQLLQLAAAGHFGPKDLVLREDMTEWVSASQVPGLFTPVVPSPIPQPQAYSPAGPYGQIPVAQQYVDYAQPHPRSRRVGESQQGMAIAGFVLALVFPLLGLIFSWIALEGMKRTRNEEGKGLATAGLVVSIVFVSITCLYFCVVGSLFHSMR